MPNATIYLVVAVDNNHTTLPFFLPCLPQHVVVLLKHKATVGLDLQRRPLDDATLKKPRLGGSEVANCTGEKDSTNSPDQRCPRGPQQYRQRSGPPRCGQLPTSCPPTAGLCLADAVHYVSPRTLISERYLLPFVFKRSG